MGHRARIVGGALLLWAAAVAVNRSLVRVRGSSMAPTLAPGEVVLTVPLLRPVRGDIVILRDPRDPLHVQVKRVVALAGETLRVSRGRLLVDGVGHVEHYTDGGGPDGRLVVPPGHLAVLGDARTASTDSRTYGAVPLGLVDARVVARVSPRPRWLRTRPQPLRIASRPGGTRAA